MAHTFEGKVALITGGASGLGQASALEILKLGGDLVLVDVNEKNLKKVKEEFEGAFKHAKIKTIVADVSDEKQVKKFVDDTVKEFGKIDAFFNNAGIEGKQAPLADYDPEMFRKVIDINLMGVYYGLKYVLKVMVKQEYGMILNTASVAGIRTVPNQGPYIASKHAVVGLTKSAAQEYADKGIRVNALAPGAILTPMVAGAMKQINPDNPEQAEKEFAANNPTKRLGNPDEVGKLVASLLSGEIYYVNGQTIAIDGGQSICY